MNLQIKFRSNSLRIGIFTEKLKLLVKTKDYIDVVKKLGDVLEHF